MQKKEEMNMNAIVAADKNWAIGYKNKLLVSIPADMKFFRQMTGGKGSCDGKKDAGKLSQRAAVEEQNEYCSDK
nr:Dihydrofolate reductase [uncultured bacterium]